MSEINLSQSPLKRIYPNRDSIPVGVCSLLLGANSNPWIICPRRLFYLGRGVTPTLLRHETQKSVLDFCNFPRGTRVGVWSEVKIRYLEREGNDCSIFDYTFDYVFVPLGARSIEEAISLSGLERTKVTEFISGGGTLTNFPCGCPIVVEVMTSSTSGGNKKTRSRIFEAFEDCLLGETHKAPGINYRQVWARMASQLIVKSQASIAWGGKTVWVLQDALANYIIKTTALDLRRFVSTISNEVNILSFAYSQSSGEQDIKPLRLIKNALYSGPIGDNPDNPCFSDIVLAPVCPPKYTLTQSLLTKSMSTVINIE